MADALLAIGAIARSSEALHLELGKTAAAGGTVFDDAALTKTLHVLASQDGMHAADWLRMRAHEASIPRRKTPPSTDLQIRLKGVQCTRLVAQLIRRDDNGESYEAYRVTIKNVRGDVASVESSQFSNALDGAIKMAGAAGVRTEES